MPVRHARSCFIVVERTAMDTMRNSIESHKARRKKGTHDVGRI